MLDKQSSSLTTLIKSERDEMYVISDYNVLPYKKMELLRMSRQPKQKIGIQNKRILSKIVEQLNLEKI
jgi:hypothetical protein